MTSPVFPDAVYHNTDHRTSCRRIHTVLPGLCIFTQALGPPIRFHRHTPYILAMRIARIASDEYY